MNNPDYHLNFFRHYAENNSDEILENNLTRALALCLLHDPLFLYGFLNELLEMQDDKVLRGQLHHLHPEDSIEINIQQRVTDLTAPATIYAVSLTEGILTEADYHLASAATTDSPITDLTIRLRDVLIVVEVKRGSVNCMSQLKGQVAAIRGNAPIAGSKGLPTLVVKPLSWASVMRLSIDLRNFRQLANASLPFITDLVTMIQSNYPHWDEALPLKDIPFHNPRTAEINRTAINKRLHSIQQHTFGDELHWWPDRVSMPIDVPWASEVISQLEEDKGEQRGYVAVQVWPANIKGQGWALYSKPLDWTQRHSITIDGKEYPVEISQSFKFSNSYGKFLGEYELQDLPAEYADRFRTANAFGTYSGQWKRADWPELEELLDRDTGSQWRGGSVESMWQDEFRDSGRNVCNLSLGFYVKVRLPYEDLQVIDTNSESWQAVGAKFVATIQALTDLINGK